MRRRSRGVWFLLLCVFFAHCAAASGVCCTEHNARCSACALGLSLSSYCRQYPLDFGCPAQCGHVSCNTTCSEDCIAGGGTCAFDTCLAAPVDCSIPGTFKSVYLRQVCGHRRPPGGTCPLSDFLLPPPPVASRTLRPGPRCVPKGCCENTGLAVCMACLNNMTVRAVCRRDGSLRGCPLCASCRPRAGCSIFRDAQGVLTSKCLDSDDPCVERPQNRCNGTCTWQSNMCVSTGSVCASCFRQGLGPPPQRQSAYRAIERMSACAAVGNSYECVQDAMWAYCPAQRKCHGPDAADPNQHFCCADGEYCDMDYYGGGPNGIFGGKCVAVFNKCRRHACPNKGICRVMPNGKVTCVDAAPQVLVPVCAPGERVVYTNPPQCEPFGLHDPCEGRCLDDQFCSVSAASGVREAECRSLKTNPQASCNELRMKLLLSPCASKCVLEGTGTRCEGEIATVCQSFVWPAPGTVTCETNSNCNEGETCTGFAPVALCNPVTGATDVYLNSGLKTCKVSDTAACVGVPTSWDESKRERCCTAEGIGCNTPGLGLNCYDGDSDSWSTGKRAFCCKNTGLGCIATLNCFDAHPQWWTSEKAQNCCRTQGVNCPAPAQQACPECVPDYCDVAAHPAPWSDAHSAWCCRNKRIGCRPGNAYNCSGSTEMASPEMKAWCCASGAKACAFDCVTDALNSDLWSSEKRQYCCSQFSVGCRWIHSTLGCDEHATPRKRNRCCAEHERGCKYDCSLAATTLGPRGMQYCCLLKGLHCPEAVPVPESTAQSSAHILLYFKVDWKDVVRAPKVFLQKTRSALATCTPRFSESVAHLLPWWVAYVQPGSGDPATRLTAKIVVDNRWLVEQDQTWNETIVYQQRHQPQKSVSPDIDPLLPDIAAMRLEIAAVDLPLFEDCIKGTTNTLGFAHHGEALPVFPVEMEGGEARSAYTVLKITTARIDIVPAANTIRGDGDDSGSQFSIGLVVGLACGGALAVACVVLGACFCCARPEEDEEEPNSQSLSINQFREMQVVLKCDNAERDQRPITTDEMGWGGYDFEERHLDKSEYANPNVDNDGASSTSAPPPSSYTPPRLCISQLQEHQRDMGQPEYLLQHR